MLSVSLSSWQRTGFLHDLGPLPRDAFSVGLPSHPGVTSLIYSTSLVWAGQDETGTMLPWHTWRGQKHHSKCMVTAWPPPLPLPGYLKALSLDTFAQLLIIFAKRVINYKG